MLSALAKDRCRTCVLGSRSMAKRSSPTLGKVEVLGGGKVKGNMKYIMTAASLSAFTCPVHALRF